MGGQFREYCESGARNSDRVDAMSDHEADAGTVDPYIRSRHLYGGVAEGIVG